MMRVERKDEYYCTKHDFRSTNPQNIVKHIECHLVDTSFEIKVVKAQMGLDH